MKELKTIYSEIRFSNPYWDYRYDRYELPNGSLGGYHYVDSKGSTMVIPKKDDETFILVKQYRYLNKSYSLEFPGGGLKDGVKPEDNARLELSEETGFDAGELVYLGEYNPCNGVTNEMCRIYLASDLIPCSRQGDESEEIEIVELNFMDIIDKIRTGELWDGMTLAAWSCFYFSQYNGGLRL